MTVEREPLVFEKLIWKSLVRESHIARRRQANSVGSYQTLNGYLLELGFKFQALWDKEFWSSVDGDSTTRARNIVETELRSEESKHHKLRSESESVKASRRVLRALQR